MIAHDDTKMLNKFTIFKNLLENLSKHKWNSVNRVNFRKKNQLNVCAAKIVYFIKVVHNEVPIKINLQIQSK